MSLASARVHASRSSPILHATPVAFVVDGDVSVCESVGALIRRAGWQSETFASARDFLARPRRFASGRLAVDVTLPGFNGLDRQRRIAVDRFDMPNLRCGRLRGGYGL